MSRYKNITKTLIEKPKKWLITGVAGFIGSNLLETLLKLNQTVVGLDNFSTGYQNNLDQVRDLVSHDQWKRFSFIRGDICCYEDCIKACEGVDYVLHQAALGSVPRSLENPIATNQANISGFLNTLLAARDAKVKSFTYASSSSTYGDHQALPKVEENIGNPLSPYALTKYMNEQYADVFFRCYDFRATGLRYFNIFGPRQNPKGAYAAVIPKWIEALCNSEKIFINGDGESSRDFTYIDNAVQMNILAATNSNLMKSTVFNVAVGDCITLNFLYETMRKKIINYGVNPQITPEYHDFRKGDVRNSLADISKAKNLLGYEPTHSVQEGLEETLKWYVHNTINKKGALI